MRVDLVGILQDGSNPSPLRPSSFADLQVPHGVSLTIRLTVQANDGTPVDLTDGDVKLSVKKHTDQYLYSPGFQKTGSAVLGRIDQVDFEIVPDDTRLLDSGVYVFDVWFVSTDERSPVIQTSTLTLLPSVLQP